MCSRFVIGCSLLVVVDLIWILSAELTRFIFKETNFNKPFFSAYFKASLLVVYIFGFLFHRPWGRSCIRCTCEEDSYALLENSDTESESSQSHCASQTFYEIIDLPTENDSDDDFSKDNKVRFSSTAEVRSLPDSQSESIARMSHINAQRARQGRRIYRSAQKLTHVAKTAFIFALPFFLGQYTFQLSLSLTAAPVVNIVSSTSGLFTLILSSIFPTQLADRFSFIKFILIVISIGGTVLISSSKIELEHEDDSTMIGAAWALVSAMCYAIYLVLLRRMSGDNLNIPMFFGFVGMFIMLMFWPGLVVMHLTGVETFQLPTREQVLYLGLNGLIGTVICELIWLYACFLTSPLQGTLALSLINPGSIVANYLIRHVAFGRRFLLGSFFNLIGYLGITLINAKGRPNKKTGRAQNSTNHELEELISS